MIPETKTNVQLKREEILWILQGIPEDPEALSHLDVKHLINNACRIKPENFTETEKIFDWLLETGWMVPAAELNAIRSGADHYFYRRSSKGNVALEGRLIRREPKWV
jgi:hypothetical protein